MQNSIYVPFTFIVKGPHLKVPLTHGALGGTPRELPRQHAEHMCTLERRVILGLGTPSYSGYVADPKTALHQRPTKKPKTPPYTQVLLLDTSQQVCFFLGIRNHDTTYIITWWIQCALCAHYLLGVYGFLFLKIAIINGLNECRHIFSLFPLKKLPDVKWMG